MNRMKIVKDTNDNYGLSCDCGNVEYITDINTSYKTFGYWWSDTRNRFEGHCKKCDSDVNVVLALTK